MQELDTFADELLKKKGENSDKKEALIQKIDDAIDQALIASLPLKQLDKLEAAVKNRTINDTILGELLEEANVDTKEVIEKTLNEFEAEYLKGVK